MIVGVVLPRYALAPRFYKTKNTHALSAYQAVLAPFHGAHVDPREDVLWVVVGYQRAASAAARRHLIGAGVRRQNVLTLASGGMTTLRHACLS